nr:ABC transporter permease [Paludibacteraceae bacterium]
MRAEYEIARRLHFSDNGSSGADGTTGRRMARPAVRVAVGGIALGVAVMIVTLAVVFGFKQSIRDKVIGFGGHIQVVNFDNNSTYEMQPILVTDSLLERLRSIPGVVSATPFYTKPGIIKTDDAFEGIVLKGAADMSFFGQNLTAGRLPENPKEVLLSERLCRKLRLGLDSTFYCYFVEEDVRVRRVTISGIYDTEFADYDDMFVIGDMATIRQLNQWDEIQASGIEVRISDFSQLDEVANEVYFATANRMDGEGNAYYTQTIEDLNPTIFAWLRLLDMNVVVIIILMLAVSAMNIISGLIILILGSIQTIGLLKSLGATNRFIRRIFLTDAAFLVVEGMVLGNVLGLVLCWIQHTFHLLPLEPTSYYVSFVPIAWTWSAWALLNIGTLVLIMLILLLPASIVSRISPARTMRWE